MSMTEELCPICKGTGKYKTAQYSGWIRKGEPLEKVCWMCGGNGKIFKQATKHALIHKYWTSGGMNALQDSQVGSEVESGQ